MLQLHQDQAIAQCERELQIKRACMPELSAATNSELTARRVPCLQVLKVSHDVSEHLSRIQGGFKRTLMTESKAFKAEATAFRCPGFS